MRQRKIIAMKRGSGKSERGGLGKERGKIITNGNEKNEKKEQKKMKLIKRTRKKRTITTTLQPTRRRREAPEKDESKFPDAIRITVRRLHISPDPVKMEVGALSGDPETFELTRSVSTPAEAWMVGNGFSDSGQKPEFYIFQAQCPEC